MAPSAIEEKKEDAIVSFKPHGKEEMTPLQAISQGVCLPGIPLYSDMDKQRHFILSHMACAFRVFARKGFTEACLAIGGNMSRPANAAGFLIHSAVHKARPDANAACHTHSKTSATFTGDAQAVYKDCGGIVFSEDEGKRNHGLLTVGHTVDEAAYLYTLMERSCEVQLMVEAAAANGVPKVPDFEYEEEQCKGEFYK
ncbi:putative class II aldolase adducin domain containing protein [Botryosphaeria dothidea]|uniref:Class II aldolase adducin domain containing protein n=1 Tax=Botryosphaeria dothidea TaxID=55169 RepID=A0A8H4II18_9PEZI|nr:putative class II aldolase adducin domain containing protein [Botryosphaeria dothidea]